MIDKEKLEASLSELPLYTYFYTDPNSLEFSPRIRYICEQECPMYGKTWACPPAVGTVEQCRERCLQYKNCLVIGSLTEVDDAFDLEETLKTRPEHEALTAQVRDLFREQGVEPYILSTEACAVCEQCAVLEGKPCRHPERMHPCVESHGINMIPILEENGYDFLLSPDLITWYSLLFY